MVRLEGVVKRFEDTVAVNNLWLEIKRGEFITLLGPSGCGKTTTLRMIAGFEEPDEGHIIINGKLMEGRRPPFQRDVNTVFQNYALFPHMSVYDNVAFGLRMKHRPAQEIDERVKDALRLVQLSEYASRMPRQLSGGQQQRVAVARALVNQPQVLLLDEPLGALDQKLRKQMQVELKHLQQQLGITFIFVTHDQEEALTMSDRVVVMRDGVIEQLGTPAEIYERPATRFVADFVGETNLLTGRVVNVNHATSTVDIRGICFRCPSIDGLKAGEEIYISLRPEMISLDEVAAGLESPTCNVCSGRVIDRLFVGSYVKTVVELANDLTLTVSDPFPEAKPVSPGQVVSLSWEPEKVVLMKS